MEVRIVGLCPIRLYAKESDDPDAEEDEQLMMKKLFWVYFPEARKILANHKVFNPQNDAQDYSFDDLFFKENVFELHRSGIKMHIITGPFPIIQLA
jgi:hypothetical protein